MSIYQLRSGQWIDADLSRVWAFISVPQNLKEITPAHMGFEILTPPAKQMHAGMIITYKVSPLLGIPITWMTEITHVEEGSYFVDEQRKGPYKIWHHEHRIKERNGGVWMEDIVTYCPPFGAFGAVMNRLVIENQLRNIFNFRKTAVEKMFDYQTPNDQFSLTFLKVST